MRLNERKGKLRELETDIQYIEGPYMQLLIYTGKDFPAQQYLGLVCFFFEKHLYSSVHSSLLEFSRQQTEPTAVPPACSKNSTWLKLNYNVW